MKQYACLVFILTPFLSFAQNNKQNIRGTVIDKLSHATIIGASVQIIHKTESKGTSTDNNGNYALTDLTPDRYEVKISYISYKDVYVPNVVVTSGKEVTTTFGTYTSVTKMFMCQMWL